MMSERAEGEALKDKARTSLGRVLAGLESRQAPVVGQIVRIIKDISGKADKMSVNDLADFISGEPTTMSRIISIAGSLGYNPSGVEISSIHHAVSLIGFERVRNLAVSILLLESAQSSVVAEANRELAGTALLSGLVAAEMGRRPVPVDSDLAFVCGALRNYGAMLAATFMSDDYSEALRLNAAAGTGEGFKTVFGLQSLELGRQVLASLNLPKPILNSLVSVSALTRRRACENPTATLIVTADFSLRLVELLQAPTLSLANYESRLESMSREYDRVFYLSRNSAKELLNTVLITLESFTSRGGFPVRSVRLFQRLECLVLERPLPQPSTPADQPPAVRRGTAKVQAPAADGPRPEFSDPGGLGEFE